MKDKDFRVDPSAGQEPWRRVSDAERPGESGASPPPEELASMLDAMRGSLLKALDPGTGELAPRKEALLREAMQRCDQVSDRIGFPRQGDLRSGQVKTSSAFILAGRQAASEGRHPVSVLMIRPRRDVRSQPGLDDVLAVADRQLRSTGDVTRLLETENVLAVCLESNRTGGLVALRRITRALAERGSKLGDYEYSLTELDPSAAGEGLIRRVGAGFRTLTVDPERKSAKRVLVIDDDPTVLAVIVEQLESCHLGIELESTTSGYEACVRFGEFEPDLVMLDIRMPEIDGRDVLSTMKKAAGGRDVKFIVASAMPEYFDEMRKRGAHDCMLKPFDLDELVGKVAGALGLESPSGRAA